MRTLCDKSLSAQQPFNKNLTVAEEKSCSKKFQILEEWKIFFVAHISLKTRILSFDPYTHGNLWNP